MLCIHYRTMECKHQKFNWIDTQKWQIRPKFSIYVFVSFYQFCVFRLDNSSILDQKQTLKINVCKSFPVNEYCFAQLETYQRLQFLSIYVISFSGKDSFKQKLWQLRGWTWIFSSCMFLIMQLLKKNITILSGKPTKTWKICNFTTSCKFFNVLEGTLLLEKLSKIASDV